MAAAREEIAPRYAGYFLARAKLMSAIQSKVGLTDDAVFQLLFHYCTESVVAGEGEESSNVDGIQFLDSCCNQINSGQLSVINYQWCIAITLPQTYTYN